MFCHKPSMRLFLWSQKQNRLLLSTDGTLLYVVLLRRYVWQGGILNHLYCRYNAALDGKDCVKCKCKTSVYPYAMPSALRRTSCYGGHPSHASFHFACFCKQKKSTDSNPYGLPSVALAKDGGAEETRTLDPHTASVML